MTIYFDQAASTWPKPAAVSAAMMEAIQEYGANPGRGGHKLARKASEVIYEARLSIAKLIGVADERRIIMTSNATMGLNLAIKGLHWERGDEVITTRAEHNSVRRPLEYLNRTFGVNIHYVHTAEDGSVDIHELEAAMNERTKLIVCTHVSNTTGVILPISKIGQLAKMKNIPFLVDASQSAGVLPLNVQDMNVTMLASAGHKGLYGPQGTGFLYIDPDIDLTPLMHGGTGHQSASPDQPADAPERYEAGTLNTPGIAGLAAGVKHVLELGANHIFEQEWLLTHYALKQLESMEGVIIYGPGSEVKRAPVISFNIEGVDPNEVSTILDEHYRIAARAGLHCSPMNHQQWNTFPGGAVRISFGIFNRQDEVDTFLAAVQEIKEGLRG